MGGAQMSRIVSSKMKEILQAPTPESKMVDEATLETMEEPKWGLNLRICALIISEEFNGTEIVEAIKNKLLGKSPQSRYAPRKARPDVEDSVRDQFVERSDYESDAFNIARSF